jgi:hypothetical protein
MMYHNLGHPANTHLSCEEFPLKNDHSLAISRLQDVSPPLKKLIFLVLFNENHYVLMVFQIPDQSLILIDGFASASSPFGPGDSSDPSQFAAQVLTHYVGLGHISSWSQRSYLTQHDVSNCGPIALLALYKELTGQPLLNERPGTPFCPEYRQQLVSHYQTCFSSLYRAGSLIHASTSLYGLQWEYPSSKDITSAQRRTIPLAKRCIPEPALAPPAAALAHAFSSPASPKPPPETPPGPPESPPPDQDVAAERGPPTTNDATLLAPAPSLCDQHASAAAAGDELAPDHYRDAAMHVIQADFRSCDPSLHQPLLHHLTRLSRDVTNRSRVDQAFDALTALHLPARQLVTSYLPPTLQFASAVLLCDELFFLQHHSSLQETNGDLYPMTALHRVAIQAALSFHLTWLEGRPDAITAEIYLNRRDSAAIRRSFNDTLNAVRKFFHIAQNDESLLRDAGHLTDDSVTACLTNVNHWLYTAIAVRVSVHATVRSLQAYNALWTKHRHELPTNALLTFKQLRDYDLSEARSLRKRPSARLTSEMKPPPASQSAIIDVDGKPFAMPSDNACSDRSPETAPPGLPAGSSQSSSDSSDDSSEEDEDDDDPPPKKKPPKIARRKGRPRQRERRSLRSPDSPTPSDDGASQGAHSAADDAVKVINSACHDLGNIGFIERLRSGMHSLPPTDAETFSRLMKQALACATVPGKRGDLAAKSGIATSPANPS